MNNKIVAQQEQELFCTNISILYLNTKKHIEIELFTQRKLFKDFK